jgi:hypothetical protein
MNLDEQMSLDENEVQQNENEVLSRKRSLSVRLTSDQQMSLDENEVHSQT